MGNNEKDLKELDNDINLDDTLDEATGNNSLNEEDIESNIETENTIESDSSEEVIVDDSSEDSIDYLEEATPNSEDEVLTEDNIEESVIEDEALTEDNIEANIEDDNTSDDLESNEEVISDEDSTIESNEDDTSDDVTDDSYKSEDESETNDLDNENDDESNDSDDEESNEEDQSNYALLLKIHDLNNQIDILKSRLDNFEKKFNTEDDAIINSANAVYKTADIEARKREGGRLGNVGLAITIIFFILGIVVVGAYAVLYTVVEGMIKANSPEKDYEALMMAANILRFASFGVLGFAGLGFLFCLLGM